jgi:hypothetical protein
VFPTLGFAENFRTAQIQASLRNDVPTNALSVPMSTYVEEPMAIRGRFNFVSYGKAGTVLFMFLNALTASTFHKGLKYYLTDMYYQSANPEDLFRGLQKAYDEDVPAGTLNIAREMSTWVYQAGYPLVIVEKSGSNFVFTQARYPYGNGEIYSVPITLASRASPNFDIKTPKFWLRERSMIVPEQTVGAWGNDWIILNVQQTGFYRVGYGENLWLAIRDALKVDPNVIHLTNRRILQEELNIGMAITNQLTASIGLEFMTYLEKEENYLVWNDANVNFQLYNRTLFGTEMYRLYMDYIVKLTKVHLMRLGYEAIGEESSEITQLRSRVKTLNCNALDGNCLQHELDKLIKYHQNETENPAPDFCAAFRQVDKTLFTHYAEELATNLQLHNRNIIAKAIHCTLNFTDELTLIIDDLTNSIEISMRVDIIRNLFTNEAGYEAALAYLERNLDQINTYTSQLGSVVQTSARYAKVNELLTKAVSDGFLTTENAQSLRSTIEGNLAWHARHFTSVKDFFMQYDTTTTVISTSPTSSTNPATTMETTTLAASGLITSITLVFATTMISLLNIF